MLKVHNINIIALTLTGVFAVYFGNIVGKYIIEIITAGHCFDILLPREHRVAADAVTVSSGLLSALPPYLRYYLTLLFITFDTTIKKFVRELK